MIQNIQSGQPLTANLDAGKIAEAAVVGAVGGLVAGATFGVGAAVMGTGFGATVATGALAGALSGQAEIATQNVLAGNDITTGLGNPADIAIGAAVGGGGAAVGYGLGKVIGGMLDDVPCSFSADTVVATASGGKSIASLKVGDLVFAYDELLKTTAAYTVTAVLVHQDPVIVSLGIDNDLITTTPEHPFFTQEHGWLPTGALTIGTHIRKANGDFGTVRFLKVVRQTQQMYNLTVAQAHTFFVGNQQWLVHNTCPIGGRFKDIAADGGERHHMPAKSVSPLDPQDGPAIRMERLDHYQTASWSNSKAAQAYRAKQAQLIGAGKMDDAILMDIEDVRSKFGSKYDEAILQMIDSLGPDIY